MNLGLSGRLTRATIRSPLTPLFLLVALAAGLVALLTIPREEDPQIRVPMVDIMVSANGLKAEDAAELITKPLETIVKAIPRVEHVYSQTQDDKVMVTARFVVGTDEDDAVRSAGFRERLVLGQEAIARMHRLGAGSLAGGDDPVDGKIRFARRRRTDADGLVGHAHMARCPIGLGIHGDGAKP